MLKAVWHMLTSRRLWIFLGLCLLAALIWHYGPLVAVGEAVPLSSPLVRGIVVGAILILWLLAQLAAQIRAMRRNQLFVTELTQAPPPGPGEAQAAEVAAKFAAVLEKMKKSRMGHRRFLREMPWYVIIGPPGTGKTTALRQSGLGRPVELEDDLRGVGGTRNCDWFFTDEAVLVDTAGRYTQQASDPQGDAVEWAGFLDLLKKHRGKRALNGVIVAISLRELLGPETELRQHGREIRKRLIEIRERLGLRLPVYLMVTKVDLVPGFEAFFADLSQAGREQVWGVTLPPAARFEPAAAGRDLRALLATLEARGTARVAQAAALAERAEIFRFPAQMLRLDAPLRALAEVVFGEARYDETPWMRGIYFTSATQEGSPLDRMVAAAARDYGLQPPAAARRAHGEARSYFLHDLMAKVIIPERGLGLFDAGAEARRIWMRRGVMAGTALAATLAGVVILLAYLRAAGAVDAQTRAYADLSGRLAGAAARQAPTDPLDLETGLSALAQVEAARISPPAGLLAAIGPAAGAEIARAQTLAEDRALRNLLEPRMVAMLEATMWRNIRDPDFLLGALKAYLIATGKAPHDGAFLAQWWQEVLPAYAPEPPFPTEAARAWQLAAWERLAAEPAASRIPPDPALVAEALTSICTIPLARRAYDALLHDPAMTALPPWIPADKAGPNAARVLTRLSGKTLRVGLPGAFTFAGFHGAILPLLPVVAGQALVDRNVFSGGCTDSAEASADSLQADMLRLYAADFIAAWDGLLGDVRLAPVTDLPTATANLKDLASPASALRRLIEAVVAETDLTRPVEGTAADPAVPVGLIEAARQRLAKLMGPAAKITLGTPAAAASEPQGADIAAHFRPLRSLVQEVDGVPPLLPDAEAALGALSAELLTVAASPDPQAVLLSRGGLPQLTGALAGVAATLPPPIGDWLKGLAGDTIGVTREAVLAQLNARWRADVLPFCRQATAGRYPFEPGSVNDVTVADFQRLFGPGQLIDRFTTEALAPYVDMTARPWRWRADFGHDAGRLVPFEKARAIRDALFPGGAGPLLAFTLLPRDLTPGAARVVLNIDGQVLTYANAAARPMPMTWPGRDGTNLVSLTMVPLDGSGELIASETGAWALLRLIREGRLAATALPEVYRLRLSLGPHAAEFELRAASVDNPFDLKMFTGFRCPDAI